MNKLGVVVLNYKNYQDTIECIASLLRQDYKELSIIIVDNNSQNESVRILEEKYDSESKVKIIKLKKNLGFAKGNNVGINYARKIENCTAVFILNSDTVLMDDHVCSAMMEKCQDNIGIINPICIGLDGNTQIPYGRFTSNLQIETLRLFFNIFSGTIQNITGFHFSFTQNTKSYSFNNLENNGFIIQGSAYILTPAFFKYYSQIYSRTFLYCEELNLAWYLHKVQLKTATVKSARILHKEGGSTGAFGYRKVLIKFKRQLSSFFNSIPVFVFKYHTLKKFFDEEGSFL